ncbi:MAG: hypothetical protein V1906_00180 [Candidatus Woesearchaeota archaeon]
MKTYALIFMGLLLLAVAGCSTPEQIVEQKIDEKIEDTKDAVKGAVVDKAIEAADEKAVELVNMKCVGVDGIYIYYFYKDKMRMDVISPMEDVDRKTWVFDKMAYSKIDVDGKDYLLTVPAEESGMTYSSAEVAYQAFKTLPNFDCEKGVVEESDFVLPDLEHITNEQMADMMMAQMVNPSLPAE